MKAGWEVKALGEVATIINGGTPKSEVAAYWDGDIDWLTPKDMGKLDGHLVHVTPRRISREGLAKCSARQVPAQSVIMSTRAPIGHLAINTVPMAFNQGCRGMVPSEKLDAKYLFYVLSANIQALDDLGTGTTFKELSAGSLKAFPIPLPPLDEQKRIVEVLDAAFEGLSRARAHTDTNLQNARELFDAAVAAIFDLEIETGEVAALENVTDLITKGSSPKWQGISYVQVPGVLFVTSENVGTNEILLDAPKYVEDAFNLKDRKSILQNGDVLTNIVGASIGRTAVFERDDVANINQAVCMMRCKQGLLLNHFLAYLLNSPFFKRQLHAAEVDNARANLSLTFFRELQIPLPSVERQAAIVDEIHGLIAVCRELQSHYRAKLADLDALRQALLQKAFAGELT